MKKDCTNCINAKWEKYPSGRRKLSTGSCQINAILPHSYIAYDRELPQKYRISTYTKVNCPCWKPLGKDEN